MLPDLTSLYKRGIQPTICLPLNHHEATMVTKVNIPARYVKEDVLEGLLIEWYGSGNFEYEVVR
jgi:hypothetical protein